MYGRLISELYAACSHAVELAPCKPTDFTSFQFHGVRTPMAMPASVRWHGRYSKEMGALEHYFAFQLSWHHAFDGSGLGHDNLFPHCNVYSKRYYVYDLRTTVHTTTTRYHRYFITYNNASSDSWTGSRITIRHRA